MLASWVGGKVHFFCFVLLLFLSLAGPATPTQLTKVAAVAHLKQRTLHIVDNCVRVCVYL